MEEQQLALTPQAFAELQKNGKFEMEPCEKLPDFDNKNQFTKLELSPEQKNQISFLMGHLPTGMAAAMMSQACLVKFPQGLPHTLTALHQGGFGSMIREGGQFVGTASLYPLQMQAATLGVFTAMSVASGQYFLTQINDNMSRINLKLKDVLAFLYGDKKAELLAQTRFVRYAYQNYKSIMAHEQQRTATIFSLQEAQKVAMKDIEFYLYDFDETLSDCEEDPKVDDIVDILEGAERIKDCLEYSQQLYMMSGTLEVYFAQNYDKEYLDMIKDTMSRYLNECRERLAKCFTKLEDRIDNKIKKEKRHFPNPIAKEDQRLVECRKTVLEIIDSLGTKAKDALDQKIERGLYAPIQEKKYYLHQDGSVYIPA